MSRATPPLMTLLPALYRFIDAQPDGPAPGSLLALSEVLDSAIDVLEHQHAALYADGFVETCDQAQLARLAALVGWDAVPAGAMDLRAMVADRIAFARAKGTAPAAQRWLAGLAGWPVTVAQADGPTGVAIVVHQAPVTVLRHVAPAPLAGGNDGPGACYRLHPLGIDTPLLPLPCGNRLIVQVRDAPDGRPSGGWQTLAAHELWLGDLSDWAGQWNGPADGGDRAPHGIRAVIDVQRGRLRLVDPALIGGALLVSFACPAILPPTVQHHRTPPRPPAPGAEWLGLVHSGATPAPNDLADPAQPQVFATLHAALVAFGQATLPGRIRILDSATHAVGHRVSDRARVCQADPNQPRRLIIEAGNGQTPVLRGTLRAFGTGIGLNLGLRDLMIDGGVMLAGNVTARIERCVIHQPGRARPALGLLRHHRHLPHVALAGAAIGAILARRHAGVTIADSIVDGHGRHGIAGLARLDLRRVTLIGAVACAHVTAHDSLFAGVVEVADRAQSSADHCWTAAVRADSSRSHPFQAVAPGLPGYAMLDRQAGAALRRAAHDGGEVGAFHAMGIAAREDLIEAELDTVLPLGVARSVAFSA
jgi:hypothetical protein